jgi:hypothetical protein
LTSEHLEQKQLPVTLHIYVDGVKEPIRLTKISLQSTSAHILYQLLEITKFDFEKSILKLRSREEYLRHDDVLCDIEYVYNCINSLKQLEFVLGEKPLDMSQQQSERSTMNSISFEQFCLNEQEKAYYPLSTSSTNMPDRKDTMKKNK